jgi:hypothetical protein
VTRIVADTPERAARLERLLARVRLLADTFDGPEALAELLELKDHGPQPDRRLGDRSPQGLTARYATSHTRAFLAPAVEAAWRAEADEDVGQHVVDADLDGSGVRWSWYGLDRYRSDPGAQGPTRRPLWYDLVAQRDGDAAAKRSVLLAQGNLEVALAVPGVSQRLSARIRSALAPLDGLEREFENAEAARRVRPA